MTWQDLFALSIVAMAVLLLTRPLWRRRKRDGCANCHCKGSG